MVTNTRIKQYLGLKYSIWQQDLRKITTDCIQYFKNVLSLFSLNSVLVCSWPLKKLLAITMI